MEHLILIGVHFDVFFSLESLVVMAGQLQHRPTGASVRPGQADAVYPSTFAFLPPCNLVSLPRQEMTARMQCCTGRACPKNH